MASSTTIQDKNNTVKFTILLIGYKILSHFISILFETVGKMVYWLTTCIPTKILSEGWIDLSYA